MKILFIHPNFPGQFKHLAPYFAQNKENEVYFACRFPNQIEYTNVKKIIVTPQNYKKKPSTHNYLREFEIATYKAQSMFKALDKLKSDGFIPDVIYAHPGWGDGMLIKDIYPDSKYIAYMEFYYRAYGADIGFNPKMPPAIDVIAKTRIRNSINLINMESADWLISPTHWQASLHPSPFYHKYSVIHEGIDTEFVQKRYTQEALYNKFQIPAYSEIVTYCARNFETYRGFENTMYAIEKISKQRKNCHFLMVGGDEVSYGSPPVGYGTYREMMLEKVKIDKDRMHWLGKLDYQSYLQVLNISDAHIYLTYPFVLSWSFLESMAMECPIVVSDTSPIHEVVTDEKNGLLADFHNPHEIAEKVITLLRDKAFGKKLGQKARQDVLKTYSTDVIIPKYEKLINDIASGYIPKLYEELKPKSYS